MSGKKFFIFEMSEWFQGRTIDAQVAPADMAAVQHRMQEAIDRDLAAAETRRAAAEAALAELSVANRDREAAAAEAEPESDDPETAAGKWRHDAELIRGLIAGTLPHERYAPGRVAAIAQRMAAAADDAAAGRHGDALAAYRDAYRELSELRAELELRHVEWLAAHREATAVVLAADTAMAGVVAVPLRDAGGRALTEAGFDLEYWSRGDASVLREDVARLVAELAPEAPGPSLQRLFAIRDQVGPELARRWYTVVADAEYEVHASQVRGNIADDVMVAIRQGAGFLVDQWGYALGDERGPVYGRLRHPDGAEIVIEVLAAPDLAPESRVRVLSYDYTDANADLIMQRVRGVVEALRAQRVAVSDPVCEPGAPELELLDVAGRIGAVETAAEAEPIGEFEIVDEEPRRRQVQQTEQPQQPEHVRQHQPRPQSGPAR